MNQHHFLITCIRDAPNVNASPTKSSFMHTVKCSNHELLLEQLINYQGGRNFTQKLPRGHTTRKDTRRSTLWDIVNWQKWQSSCTKSQLLALMTLVSRRRNWNRLENYQKYAHRLSWNAKTWHELVDLTFLGRSTNLQEHLPSWQELVTEV